jgi:type I restriction enzyme S subunit
MIAGLKPYAEYKDSALPWLGQVPAHWQIVRSKRLFSARKDLARPDDQQLSATQAYGVIEQTEFERRSGHRVVKISMHLDKRKHVEKDDFVISMRSFQGGIERAWATGAIRSSYVVLKPGPDVNAGFFQYVLKSPGYIRALQSTGDFIRDGQDLNFANFVRVDLPSVPLEEQAAIARFLDWANGRVERAIRAKRKVIALLIEQRAAVIQRAVTQGLDSRAQLKASGVPWLGEIPRHWDVQRLGRVISVLTGYPFTSAEFVRHESAVRLLRGVNVTPSGVRWRDVVRWQRRLGDGLEPFELHVGDIVLGMDRPVIGAGVRATRIEEADTPSLLLQRVARLRPSERLQARFLLLLLRGGIFSEYMMPLFTGISVPHLSPEQIRAFKVALPPIGEQEAIADSVERSTAGIANAVTRMEREIELLREYRTRLVADVVTGKLDVREAVAGLPDEAAPDFESRPTDEADDSELIDEEATEA